MTKRLLKSLSYAILAWYTRLREQAKKAPEKFALLVDLFYTRASPINRMKILAKTVDRSASCFSFWDFGDFIVIKNVNWWRKVIWTGYQQEKQQCDNVNKNELKQPLFCHSNVDYCCNSDNAAATEQRKQTSFQWINVDFYIGHKH